MIVAAEGWARTATPASCYASRGPADPLGPEVEAIAGAMALAEARALLREHEPAHGWNDCAWPRVGHYATLAEMGGRGLQGGAALAEALEAFVLCPALPRGYGLNVNDCACGGCTRGKVA